MKKLFLFFILGFCISFISAQNIQYSKAKIWLDGKDIMELGAMGLEIDHGVFRKGQYLVNDFTKTDLRRVEDAGFRVEILIEDVVEYYQKQQHDYSHSHRNSNCTDDGIDLYPTPDNFSLGSMGGFFKYNEMLAHLDQMQALYPNLITIKSPISSIQTHEGRPIYGVIISDNPNSNESEPQVLYNAIHHAREPAGMSQLIFYMWYLLENYSTNPDIKYLVDNTEMHFVPCINPDGYIYNETTNPNGGGLWRKNKRDNNNDGTFDPSNDGVDLNRNYGYEWGLNNTGSSPNPGSDVYRGPSAFSEPETSAVKEYCENHSFELTLNYHTYGNLLIHPWGYNDGPTPEDALFKEFCVLFTRENSYTYGTGAETVGYNVNGDSDDWMYGEQMTKDKCYSMTPEAGASGFWFPANQIEDVCKDNLWQNLAMAYVTMNYMEAVDTNGDIITNNTGVLGVDAKQYGLRSAANEVSIVPVSSNINISTAPINLNLVQFGTQSLSFDYTLSASIQEGDEIKYEIWVDNGNHIFKKEYTRTYAAPINGEVVFDDEGNAIPSNWTLNEWSNTSANFYSAPSSVTDSPNGDYAANQNRRMISKNIDLSEAGSATLEFYTQWEIEANYDYVQFRGITPSNPVGIDLCGLYTKLGSQYQAEDESLFDGVQNQWVLESMNLEDFLGEENFTLQIGIVSDNFVEGDGFYFDDMQVIIERDNTISVENVNFDNEIILAPNPTKDFFTVLNADTDSVAELYDSLGRLIKTQRLSEKDIDVSSLSPGVYLTRITLSDGVNVTKRIIVQ